MKLSRRKKTTQKPLYLTLAGLVLVAVIGGILLWRMQPNSLTTQDTNSAAPTNTVDYGPPTAEEKADQEAQKTKLLENTTGDGSANTSPPDTSLTITITRVGQTASGQPVSVRTIVGGVSSGVCEATFNNRAGSSFTKTLPVVVNASTITCNGDIETNAFTAGEWQLSIVVKNQGAASQPTTAAFTVEP